MAIARLWRAAARLDLSLTLGALPVIALAMLGWRKRWATEDAYIDFRVVDNLLHGLGPVFNSGERVEAYTNPLWVAILVGIHGPLSFLNLPWTAVVLGLVLTLVGFAAASLGALRLWRAAPGAETRLGLPLGALALVALRPVWDYATSGLETGLVFAWRGLAHVVRCSRS